MIKVKDATQFHQKQLIFEDVHFSIERGERVALVGRNGAGKSTLLYSMLGFIPLKKGDIRIKDQVVDWKKRADQKFSFLPEKFQLYTQLTVEENVNYFADMLRIPRDETERVLTMTNMWNDKDKRITKLSKGMLQRVGLSISILGEPEIIILDEPTSGLDPFGRTDIMAIMRKIATEDKVILFSTHNMDEVRELATHVLYLEDKKIQKMQCDAFLERLEGSKV